MKFSSSIYRRYFTYKLFLLTYCSCVGLCCHCCCFCWFFEMESLRSFGCSAFSGAIHRDRKNNIEQVLILRMGENRTKRGWESIISFKDRTPMTEGLVNRLCHHPVVLPSVSFHTFPLRDIQNTISSMAFEIIQS